MYTYQDFLLTNNKENFIEECINYFRTSNQYLMALESRKYYAGENTSILKRLQWFYNSMGIKENDKFKANNQVPNEFYRKIIMQQKSYLLSNGVSMEDDVKELLSKKLDLKLQKLGSDSLLDGVSYAYCYINNNNFDFANFKGIEFIPLHDEKNNNIMAGIRFYQINANKPMYIELYEIDGMTEYRSKSEGGIELINPKIPYKITKKIDILGEEIISQEGWSMLPIIPFYANDLKMPTMTVALKNKLDLYDVIMSDFGNNLEDNNDVYWILKNYQGQDIGEFLADYKYYKTVSVDEQGDAKPHTIDVPYNARETALNILRKEIFESAMALDISVLSGGSLTNVAIKANMADLDLKTDSFEIEALEFMEKLIDLYNYNYNSSIDYNIKFIRRTLINDTETVDNILKFRADIDHKTALRLNPYIDDDEIEDIIEAMEEESIEKYSVKLDNINLDDEQNIDDNKKSPDDGEQNIDDNKNNKSIE